MIKLYKIYTFKIVWFRFYMYIYTTGSCVLQYTIDKVNSHKLLRVLSALLIILLL